MKTTAAVVHEAGKPLEIEELDLAGPGDGEVLVRFTHAGINIRGVIEHEHG